MSTLKTNTIKNTDDVEMYLAKAWVNFNGTGTVVIRAAGNVSSITDNSTGNYTVNFTNAMSDANYSASGILERENTSNTDTPVLYTYNGGRQAGSLRIQTGYPTYNPGEFPAVFVQVFR